MLTLTLTNTTANPTVILFKYFKYHDKTKHEDTQTLDIV